MKRLCVGRRYNYRFGRRSRGGTGTATHEDLQATVDELIPLVDGEIDDLAALTPLKNWQVAADAALINERELVPAPFAEWPTRNCPL